MNKRSGVLLKNWAFTIVFLVWVLLTHAWFRNHIPSRGWADAAKIITGAALAYLAEWRFRKWLTRKQVNPTDDTSESHQIR